MDLRDSMDKIKNQDFDNSKKKYIEAAKKYSSQGFDDDVVAELLQIDGCDIDHSKKIASEATSDIPLDYKLGPPISYEDVKETVQKTIVGKDLNTLNEYFENYASNKKEIVNKIAAARTSPSGIMTDQIHDELEPLVANLILANMASVKTKGIFRTSQKEQMEKDLFGVWPTELIDAYNRKKAGDEKIQKKVDKKVEQLLKF